MLAVDLAELGFSGEEIKVYLAVLELGGGYVSTIAKKAQVNRVACYHTLEKLQKKEVIRSVRKNNVKYFTPEAPETIVDRQKQLFEKAKNLLPQLTALTRQSAYSPKIQYYEGLDGIRKIFEDTLSSKDEIVGYTNLANLPQAVGEDYLRDYAKRKMSAKLKSRMLSPISEDALRYLKKYYPPDFDHNLVEILFVNQKEFHFEYEINIYQDKVSIISLNPKELIGMIIESPIYAKTERAIFNLAWLGATSFVAK